MKKLTAIIADDEELVRERIRTLIKPYEWVTIKGEFTNGQSVIDCIQDMDIDLLFLDIKMPRATGFEVLDSIDHQKIKIVFITAYDEYALKAFDYAAFDYLIKPIAKIRFEKTMQRLRYSYSQPDWSNQSMSIKSAGTIKKILVKEISHIEADDNYIKVHVGDQQHKKRSTLANIEEELKEVHFVRVHRSYLINTQYIVDMVRIYKGDYLIKMRNGRIVPTSKSYRQLVKTLY